MKIVETHKYKNELREIALHIKKDKKSASIKFVEELKESVNKIENFPLKHRKSIYFNNENIRDMVFKHYTIIYEINTKEENIVILAIFNQNLPNMHSDYHPSEQKG